jgi:hypothetical protein
MISVVDLQVASKLGTIRTKDGQVTDGLDPALTPSRVNAWSAADPRHTRPFGAKMQCGDPNGRCGRLRRIGDVDR